MQPAAHNNPTTSSPRSFPYPLVAALPPPLRMSTVSDSTPTRRRAAEPSKDVLLASIGDENGTTGATPDNSKIRRGLHLELGPLVISGAALDRVRARAASL